MKFMTILRTRKPTDYFEQNYDVKMQLSHSAIILSRFDISHTPRPFCGTMNVGEPEEGIYKKRNK